MFVRNCQYCGTAAPAMRPCEIGPEGHHKFVQGEHPVSNIQSMLTLLKDLEDFLPELKGLVAAGFDPTAAMNTVLADCAKRAQSKSPSLYIIRPMKLSCLSS